MTEDRPVQDEIAAIQALRTELEDLKSTNMARIAAAVAEARRRPTGDIEHTLRSTPKPGTLFLLGQTLNRAEYLALWTWVIEQGLNPGVFGNGNGTTTFTLPNAAGRTIVGAGTLSGDTYTLGALLGVARHTLTSAEMPSHTHNPTNGTMNSAGSHGHNPSGGSMTSAGSHGAHNGGSFSYWASLNDGQGSFTIPTSFNNSAGSHSHGFDFNIDSAGSHSHVFSLDITNTGGGGAHENRPPSLVGNIAIWT